MQVSQTSSAPLATDLASFDQSSGSWLERVLFNHRRAVVFICLLLTLFLGWQATKLELSASFEKTIPGSHPYVVNYLAHQNDLQGLGNAVRIAVANPEGQYLRRPVPGRAARIQRRDVPAAGRLAPGHEEPVDPEHPLDRCGPRTALRAGR